jgi:transcriptional regulator with XRE-family HTH domain
MKKTVVEEYVNNLDHMRLFQQERAIVEVTDLLEEALEAAGISRSEFAKRLGKSKGWVTQLLDGEGNKTIRTVADAFAVLGFEFRSFRQPIQISNKEKRPASVNGTVARATESQAHPVLRLYGGIPPVRYGTSAARTDNKALEALA